MADSIDQDILSDDECGCKFCSAILFIPIFDKYIPITQKDYDELFPSIFVRFIKNRNLIPNQPFIYPSSFKF